VKGHVESDKRNGEVVRDRWRIIIDRGRDGAGNRQPRNNTVGMHEAPGQFRLTPNGDPSRKGTSYQRLGRTPARRDDDEVRFLRQVGC